MIHTEILSKDNGKIVSNEEDILDNLIKKNLNLNIKNSKEEERKNKMMLVQI